MYLNFLFFIVLSLCIAARASSLPVGASNLSVSELSPMTMAPAMTKRPSITAGKFQEVQKNLVEAEKKQRKILGALYLINKKLRTTVLKKSKLEKQKAALSVQHNILSKQIENLNQDINRIKKELATQIRWLGIVRNISLPRMILTSTSASQLDSNIKISNIVMDKQAKLFKQFSNTKSKLAESQKNLGFKINQLKSVEEKLISEEKAFHKEQVGKQKILNGVRKQKIFTAQTLNHLKQKLSAEDVSIIQSILTDSFGVQKGFLETPILGSISKGYGLEKDQNGNWSIYNKGVFIKPKQNQEVKSVFDGNVVWMGLIEDLGTTAIVDHGDHYFTVYGGLEQPLVRQGDVVKRSQPLAMIGKNENTSELYFEIRHFSETDDPQLWLKGRQL